MQHLWIHHRQNECSFKTYQELIERVKLTPRQWNSSTNINQNLKYLTWALGTSINLIKFKKKINKLQNTFPCSHTSNCFMPIYQFHNPYTKLVQKKQSNFSQINILEFNSHYYSLPSDSCYPVLINKVSNFNFDLISKNDIQHILYGNQVKSPFMVALYSTPSYIRTQYTNIINQNIIGVLKNNATQILHLFLTPHLNGTDFDVYQLETLNHFDHKSFNQKNYLSCTRSTEGNINLKMTNNTNKNILNQEYCVCDHLDTARYFAPTSSSFKPLGEFKKHSYSF